MTLKVIPLLQAFSSAIRRTFVQYFARFQLTARRAVSQQQLGFLSWNSLCKYSYDAAKNRIHVFYTVGSLVALRLLTFDFLAWGLLSTYSTLRYIEILVKYFVKSETIKGDVTDACYLPNLSSLVCWREWLLIAHTMQAGYIIRSKCSRWLQ